MRYLAVKTTTLNIKQSKNESVAQFASKMRNLCLHLDLPVEESVNFFIDGLKPEFKKLPTFAATKNIFRSRDVRKT